ncbi:polysaccharide lyase [Natrialbaceae archaeon GCM10025810]|uniref:polysaccharide lyase n=1 Tax=Halovalidus salilacus TaxID=3075124 RepID=UPI00360AD4D8
MTTNHDYNTPDEGSTDWHIPLNENFEKLDTDIEIRDEEANRSEYTPHDGAKFFAVDTGAYYLGDGSSWQKLSIPQEIADRLAELEERVESLEEDGETDKSTESTAEPDAYFSLDSESSLEDFMDSGYSDHLVDIVSSPTYDGRDSCRLSIPSGENQGPSMHHHLENIYDTEPESLHARYWLRFDGDFRSSYNGKLPGFAATNGESDASGGDDISGRDGWSCRGAFGPADSTDEPIDIRYYVYHVDQGGEYGDQESWNTELERDQWYQVDQYIELNTPGENDGVLRGWVDEELRYERTDFRWRDVDELTIQTYWCNFFHGGSDVAPTDLAIYWADLHLWEDQQL